MSRSAEELAYWRGLWRKARGFAVDLADKGWCNYWHQHFDWYGRGKRSRFEHRKHIRPLMHTFARVQRELARQATPCQVFVRIYPSDPGSDAVYVHTPNPYSEFPDPFADCRFIDTVPPLLMGLVTLERYRIGVSECDGGALLQCHTPVASGRHALRPVTFV